MNKKSFLFVFLLTVTLFLMNQWFYKKNDVPEPTPKPVVEKVAPSAPISTVGEQLYTLENAYQKLVFSNIGGALTEINLKFNDIVRPIEIDRDLNADSYPLLRQTKQPAFYAMRTPGTYSVKEQTDNHIVFTGPGGITKTYSFPKEGDDAPYVIDLTITGSSRGTILASGVPEVELISGSSQPTVKYMQIRGGKPNVEKVKLPKNTIALPSVDPDWVVNSNGFFGIIMDPLTKIGSGFDVKKIEGLDDPTRFSRIGDDYPAKKYPGYEVLMPLNGESIFRLYAGPLDKDVLATVDSTYTDVSARYNPNYVEAISYHGWFSFISAPFAKFLFLILNFFHMITRSWGISIILLTVVLRLMLYPLNAWSIKSTAKMQKVAPKVAKIQEKYKKEPKKAQLEVMQLYKSEGVNPLSGCFPILIQMPFLIGMFDLLKSSFPLRGATFIPGWIDNLTAPDTLFCWDTSIIFFGTCFHLLPILLGGVMWLQQRFMSTAPKDPSKMSDQQKQQKNMGNIMAIVFTVLFYNFPSGLNIYWLSSMALGILQQWYMKRKLLPKTV